jgi:hypothetical protein
MEERGGGRANRFIVFQTDATERDVDLVRDGGTTRKVRDAKHSRANLIGKSLHPGASVATPQKTLAVDYA